MLGAGSPVLAQGATFPITIVEATGKSLSFKEAPKFGCIWFGCVEIMADLGVVPYVIPGTKEDLDSVFAFPNGIPEKLISDETNGEQWAAAPSCVALRNTRQIQHCWVKCFVCRRKRKRQLMVSMERWLISSRKLTRICRGQWYS